MGLFWRSRSTEQEHAPADDFARPDVAYPAYQGDRRRRGLLGRLSWQWRIAILLPAFAASFAAFGFSIAFVYYTMAFPDPISLRHKEKAPIIRILARDGEVLAERGAAHDYMPLDLLPSHVMGAVVATEDRRFHQHHGIDPWGLLRAAFANLRARRYVQGGSTLTQQLAKNLFLTPERTFERKVEELVLALWLELRLTKQDILELYLNRVYFGAGAYGIEAAAQRYFDKSARELDVGEAAVIAGLLKAPSKFSPASSPGAARSRARSVLQKMQAAGLITAEVAQRASRESVRFADNKFGRDPTGVEYAVDHVLERLPGLLGAGHAEVIVETTIDGPLQRRAQVAVQRALDSHGEAQQVGQAAVVMLDAEGGIRALVGGRSYADSQFNRAVKARRQPGSAFKPFVYLTALEHGLTPETVTYDLPINIGAWSPRNESGQYKGAVTLRQGLTQSINTVAVRLQQDIGAHRIVNTAQRLGVRSGLHADPSLALGTSEVTLLELTGAYGAFANGGSRVDPHIVRRVRISSGRVLATHEPSRMQQVVAPVHVGAMNDMLNSALVAGTGRRAALPRHPAAGKTGTTQDFRDAWFVGYTAHLVGGVWVGNDNGRTMNQVKGGGLPAQIWRDVMLSAHEGRAPLALPGTAPLAAAAPEQPAGTDAVQQLLDRPQPPNPLAPASAPQSPPQHQRQPDAMRAAGAPPTQPARGEVARYAAPSQPRERIDPDFVARMVGAFAEPRLAGTEPLDATTTDPARLIPRGMMSLGAGR